MQRKQLTTRQTGFSLVTAIFLLTILASLGAFVVVLSGVSQQTPILGLNGANAYHAARSGLEWGIDRAINGGGACTGNLAVDDFNVVVACNGTPHRDGNTDIMIYTINAVAIRGAPGQLNYARRELSGTVSPSGPL